MRVGILLAVILLTAGFLTLGIKMEKVNLMLFKQTSPKQVIFNLMLWLTLISAALLFAPTSLMQTLRLELLVNQYAHFIGLGLIVGAAYLLTQVTNYFLDEAIKHLKGKRTKETIEKKVRLLDPTERALLREFFLQGETVLTLPENEAAVQSLLQANILQYLGNKQQYAIHGPTADFKIAMEARSQDRKSVV